VVRDLQHVEAGEAASEERRVHVILGVAGEEEPAAVRLAQEDDGGVVDPAAGGRRLDRHEVVRPEDVHGDLVEAEARAGGQRRTRRTVAQRGVPGLPAGALPVHPWLEHASDAVARQHADQPRDMVLVGMGEHDEVDAPVPGRDPRVELHEQPIGIGAAVHQHAASGCALDEDRVALANVEHDEAGGAARGVAQGKGGDGRDQEGDRDRRATGTGRGDQRRSA
jgi:hypothetical protein